ncbi:exosortase/archaeosortase family protein [Dysgonomonadaceae bacterium PH5-43]|nr:exosortase/archaeosortase family protein [Dysgonomonadaceae bacterium PH5-43]
MNRKTTMIWDTLTPFKSIIYFTILLFFFHFSWKILIDGDIEDDFILFLGKDITPDWIYSVQVWFTNAAAWFIRLFPNTDNLVVNGNVLSYTDGLIGTRIIWGCTGIKQMTIFVGIMIFYRCFTLEKDRYSIDKYKFKFLPYWNKLWYIPLGCIILTLYNIVRIGSISLLIRYNPDIFDSLHDGVFRIIYYTIIFLLWVIWEEVFVIRKSRKKI